MGRGAVRAVAWAALALALGGMGARHWSSGHREATGPVDSVPAQEPDPKPMPFAKKGYILEPKALYRIEAKLLSKRSYSGGDGELMPWDFAMGWGPMSHERELSKLDITQSGRFYFYHWDHEPPMDPALIVKSSANMHLIPATPAVESALASAKPGWRVELEGRLVDVAAADGRRWTTSLTREDAGAGACEIMFVERARVTRP